MPAKMATATMMIKTIHYLPKLHHQPLASFPQSHRSISWLHCYSHLQTHCQLPCLSLLEEWVKNMLWETAAYDMIYEGAEESTDFSTSTDVAGSGVDDYSPGFWFSWYNWYPMITIDPSNDWLWILDSLSWHYWLVRACTNTDTLLSLWLKSHVLVWLD